MLDVSLWREQEDDGGRDVEESLGELTLALELGRALRDAAIQRGCQGFQIPRAAAHLGDSADTRPVYERAQRNGRHQYEGCPEHLGRHTCHREDDLGCWQPYGEARGRLDQQPCHQAVSRE